MRYHNLIIGLCSCVSDSECSSVTSQAPHTPESPPRHAPESKYNAWELHSRQPEVQYIFYWMSHYCHQTVFYPPKETINRGSNGKPFIGGSSNNCWLLRLEECLTNNHFPRDWEWQFCEWECWMTLKLTRWRVLQLQANFQPDSIPGRCLKWLCD
jgi:hypothetical protein